MRLNYVRPYRFCALTYRNVTPDFENLKYRRIPYNMIIKVTEFIRIDILVCQSQPLFLTHPLILEILSNYGPAHSMFRCVRVHFHLLNFIHLQMSRR